MSFSNELKSELVAIQIKKNCCKKSFLYGLLYQAESLEKNRFRVKFLSAEIADLASRLLGDNATPVISEKVLVGRRVYFLDFYSKALSLFFTKLSHGETINDSISFQCELCCGSFLRGIVASYSSVNDPHKDYRLEIVIEKHCDEFRKNALIKFLQDSGSPPKTTQRSGRCVLYYRSNMVISDILNYVGAINKSFDFANVYIEMDIRNYENRATNCVATNISKSVEANKKYIDAIQKLKIAGELDILQDDLRITAELRLEHGELTLSELALLHEPPISKSGLNHRLNKLLKLANDR